MNAIRIEAGGLVWGEAWDPAPPGPGEIAIRVAATAVNRADLLQRAGLYPPPPGASAILGLECSGTVAALGDGVEHLAVGQHVCALLAGGGYAEVAVCPAGQVLPVPPGLSLAQAAALPEALATTWMALGEVGRLQPGERVVLHAGASGIGTAAIQVCRAWGNPVFVTVGSADKVDRCVSLGADGGAVRTEGPWADAVAAWAPGGVDVIVDPVAAGYLQADQQVLAVGGRIVVLGLMGGRQDQLDLGRLLVKRQTVTGTTLRSRPADDKARIVQAVRERIWPLIAQGEVRPVIDRVLPITESDRAHQIVASNDTVGKVVLTVP
jgi:putative PIG3 family NAD(P)H quinone oxidoreductase